MEKRMVLSLFFEVVMFMIKDTVSTKTSFMRNMKLTRVIKGTLCRYENLKITSSSHKNNMPKVLQSNSVYFLRYTQP